MTAAFLPTTSASPRAAMFAARSQAADPQAQVSGADPETPAAKFAGVFSAALKDKAEKRARPAADPDPNDGQNGAATTLAAALLPNLPPPPPPTAPEGDSDAGENPESAAESTLPKAALSGQTESGVMALAPQAEPLVLPTPAPLADTDGAPPAGARKPELAFAIRMAETGPSTTAQPEAPAAANAGAASAVEAPAAAPKPAASSLPKTAAQDPQPAAEDGRDRDSVVPVAAAQNQRPGSAQPERDQEPRRSPASSAPAAQGPGTPGTSVAAPAPLAPVASEHRAHAPEAAAPPQPAQAEMPRVQPRDPAIRELSLAIPAQSPGGEKAEQVSLRVVERAGEVQVAVHTADPELAGALRQHLPDLVSALSDRGYQAETWQPLAGSGGGTSTIPGAASAAPNSGAGQDPSGQAGDGSRQGGNPAGQQQQQQQRHPQEQGQPSWFDALTGSAARSGSSLYGYTY